MLYRQAVPMAVGINWPPFTTAIGNTATMTAPIFILRFGKSEKSRSVDVVCT
jgi:hypothetical protein